MATHVVVGVARVLRGKRLEELVFSVPRTDASCALLLQGPTELRKKIGWMLLIDP